MNAGGFLFVNDKVQSMFLMGHYIVLQASKAEISYVLSHEPQAQ